MNKRDDGKSRFSIEDDYLELLNNTRTDDEYEDIYSDSSHDEYVDVYSDSSKDVYIGKKTQEDDGVYISAGRRNRVYQSRADYSSPTMETPRVAPQQMYTDVYDDDDDEEVSDYESRRERSRKRHPFLKVIAVILVISIIGCVGLYMLAKSTVSSITDNFVQAEDIVHIDEDLLISEPHVKNILLIGCDKADGGASRSDSMMIVSVNSKTGKVTVVSILRDIFVDIPGERQSKINHAHSWGGANLLIQTIEHNFGIKIDDYATINFEMFESLVDGLGGVTVDVSEAEADHINEYFKLGKNGNPEKVEPGENVHLNGYQALCYARIRKIDSDFNRTERQRKIISSIADNVKQRAVEGGVEELMTIAQQVAPYIETTLSDEDIMSLITTMAPSLVSSVGDENGFLVSSQIPFEDTWYYDSDSRDGSIIAIDVAENSEMLYDLLYSNEAP